jgi:ubiquinone/menaquinone biosynthesis C-methylase UbiE
MGLGGNAAFLINHGLRVVGVDISEFALQKAHSRLPTLMPVLADLSHFYLPENTFDVIINFYYLQRNLWTQYYSALRSGGLLIVETLTVEMLNIQPEIEKSFLLEVGELRTAFPNMENLFYREGLTISDSGHQRATASLLARKR